MSFVFSILVRLYVTSYEFEYYSSSCNHIKYSRCLVHSSAQLKPLVNENDHIVEIEQFVDTSMNSMNNLPVSVFKYRNTRHTFKIESLGEWCIYTIEIDYPS